MHHTFAPESAMIAFSSSSPSPGRVVAQLRLNGSKVLSVQLNGETVRAITGAMVAFDGKVTFRGAGMGGGGGRLQGRVQTQDDR